MPPLYRSYPIALVVVCSCATTLPVLGTSHTVQPGHADFVIGSAARLPLGTLRRQTSDEQQFAAGALTSGGVVPVASASLGLGSDWDVRLSAIGTAGLLEMRGKVDWGDLDGGFRLLWGAGVFGGYVEDDQGSSGEIEGERLGMHVPLLLAYHSAEIVSAWAGLRGAAERTWLTVQDAPERKPRAWGLRAGAVIGVSIGFRAFHGFLECTVDYEYWSFASASSVKGFSLTPAFGVRIRL